MLYKKKNKKKKCFTDMRVVQKSLFNQIFKSLLYLNKLVRMQAKRSLIHVVVRCSVLNTKHLTSN